MNRQCTYCGAALPIVSDVYCPTCRGSLEDAPLFAVPEYANREVRRRGAQDPGIILLLVGLSLALLGATNAAILKEWSLLSLTAVGVALAAWGTWLDHRANRRPRSTLSPPNDREAFKPD